MCPTGDGDGINARVVDALERTLHSSRAPFPNCVGRGISCFAMAKRFKAAIIGGSGYGGGEMARRLLMHPDVELVRVASIDHVGEPLGAVHPNLEGATDLVFEDLAPAEAARGCDVALLALPHKVTAAKVPELISAGVKIVDMSGDSRLRDAAAYEKYYGAKHPHPELLGSFVYGLPELNRAEIKRAKYVASPGCVAPAGGVAPPPPPPPGPRRPRPPRPHPPRADAPQVRPAAGPPPPGEGPPPPAARARGPARSPWRSS